jgi:hypothetical protein
MTLTYLLIWHRTLRPSTSKGILLNYAAVHSHVTENLGTLLYEICTPVPVIITKGRNCRLPFEKMKKKV